MSGWTRRFDSRGVFWRQFARFGALNLPVWMEPIALAFWSFFFLFWGSGRRGVMRNLAVIKPGSSAVANLCRAYRVFWNFAWTMNDTLRFKELRTMPDWEFEGLEYFEQLTQEQEGAIILTAHMGSYDLGAHVFSQVCGRSLYMVRAPEVDPDTQRYETEQADQSDSVRVEFNTKAGDLALELLDAVRSREIVAIQGDRVTAGVSSYQATLFGKTIGIPAGPFALAMAARVPIYPMFIIRRGRRRYRLETSPPISVQRRSKDRDADLQDAIAQWAQQLEQIVSSRWDQWFAFDPYYEEQTA